MRKIIFQVILITVTFFIGCKTEEKSIPKKAYSRHVGDIEFDASTDNANFKVCNGEDKIFQYFNIGVGPVYVGEKSTFKRIFNTKYKPVVLDKSQNGLVRIRFIVNCEGDADRFRILQAAANYKETEFDQKIVSQLIEIVKGIEEWVILYNEDKQPADYYNYIIFRITDGQITEILP